MSHSRTYDDYFRRINAGEISPAEAREDLEGDHTLPNDAAALIAGWLIEKAGEAERIAAALKDGSLDGHVVEFFRQPSSTGTGIIGNVPATRRTARVNHVSRDGEHLVSYGPEGNRVQLRPEEITGDLGKAEAGWARWQPSCEIRKILVPCPAWQLPVKLRRTAARSTTFGPSRITSGTSCSFAPVVRSAVRSW